MVEGYLLVGKVGSKLPVYAAWKSGIHLFPRFFNYECRKTMTFSRLLKNISENKTARFDVINSN